MQSSEYRMLVRKIVKNSMAKKFPGIKRSVLDEAAIDIARSIHARLYGADVDGVGSPVWRDHSSTADCNRGQPDKTAEELLK